MPILNISTWMTSDSQTIEPKMERTEFPWLQFVSWHKTFPHQKRCTSSSSNPLVTSLIILQTNIYTQITLNYKFSHLSTNPANPINPVKLPTSCYLCLGTTTWLKEGSQLPHQNQQGSHPLHYTTASKWASKQPPEGRQRSFDLAIRSTNQWGRSIGLTNFYHSQVLPVVPLAIPCLHCGRPSKAIQQLDALRLRGPHHSRLGLNGAKPRARKQRTKSGAECLTVTNQKLNNSTTQGLPNFPTKAALYLPSSLKLPAALRPPAVHGTTAAAAQDLFDPTAADGSTWPKAWNDSPN